HTQEQRPDAEFLEWLVTERPGSAPDEEMVKQAAGGELAATLVGEGTLGELGETRVEVPMMELKAADGELEGRLAWWTGDQGVKAALAMKEVDAGNEFEAASALQAAPRNRPESAEASAGAQPFAGTDFTDGRVEAWSSFGQSAHFADDESYKSLFHDLAVNSTGLLTNVTRGGFRKDLSMELERDSPSDYPLKGNHASSRPDPRLYTVASPVGRDEPGINLMELWLYYNLYKELNTSTASYTTGGQIPAGTDVLNLDSNRSVAIADPFLTVKQPPIISYQAIFSFETKTKQVEGGGTAYELRLVVDPVLTVWNPLDVPVVLPSSANYAIKYWMIPYDINVSINGQAPVRCPLISSLSKTTLSGDDDYNYMSVTVGREQPMVLRPGEVVKMSQTSKRNESQKIGHNIHAKAGFEYADGVSLPVRDLNGNNIELNANDTISYTLSPNDLTSGKHGGSGNSLSGGNNHSGHFALTMNGVYLNTRDDDAYNVGGVYIDGGSGGYRGDVGERSNGTKPKSERQIATDHPDVFKTFAGASQTRELSAASISNLKAPIMLFSYNVKTEYSSELGTKALARYNPSCQYNDFYDLSQAERDLMPFEVNITPLTSWINNQIELSANGNGYFGGGYNAEFGVPRYTAFSVPRQPVISLGALQHSRANGFVSTRPTGYHRPLLPQISHAIGNSLAPSVLPPDKTSGTLASPLSAQRPLADHSYLANRALWDDWFFSSIAPERGGNSQKEVASLFFNGEEPLRNARYRPELYDQSASEVLNRLFAASDVRDEATFLSAAHLRVEGLFNVNSTSVEAWKTVLSALRDRALVERDDNGGRELSTDANGKTPVASLLSSQDENAPGDAGPNAYWDGRRLLEEEEITELAEELVKEIRRRGPFLSLADFVNRRPGNDKELARAGALQSAIDRSTINDDHSTRQVQSGDASRFAFPEAEEGPLSQGAADLVDQADILTPIAPYLSARSDSFVIRAYGEAVGPDGTVTARAWCEATVERAGAYLDEADEPDTLPDDLASQVNQVFGREFRLVSFRWLSKEEV
ncbi:MAG: hypothetical protein ACQKBY_07445, partial [Verrucomicrobiales bacterium]